MRRNFSIVHMVFVTVFLLAMADARPLRADPVHLWSANNGCPYCFDTESSVSFGRSVAVDDLGNVIVAGDAAYYYTEWPDWCSWFPWLCPAHYHHFSPLFTKYDSNGVPQWTVEPLHGPCYETYGCYDFIGVADVDADGTGSVVVVGNFGGTIDLGGDPLVSDGSSDIFLVKFDANGSHQWSRRFGGISDDSNGSVAVDASDNIVITGFFNVSIDFGGDPLVSNGINDIFLAKFDANGVHQWSRRFGGTGGDAGSSVAVDALNNVVVTGFFNDSIDFGGSSLVSDGLSDIFLAKFDASGVHQWSSRFGDINDDYASCVTVDNSSNLAVAGQFGGTVNFGGDPLVSDGASDIFLAKFDAGGVHQFSRRFGDPSQNTRVSSVAANSLGQIVMTGAFQSPVDFGGGELVNNGSDDIFLAKYDANGVHQWSHGFGSAYGDYASSVAIDGSNNVVITGDGYVDFGGGPFPSCCVLHDLVVAKFGDTTTGIDDGHSSHTLSVTAYPNPFNPSTTVEYSLPEPGRVNVSIYDPKGSRIATLVDEFELAGTHNVRWDGRDARGELVSSGVYFARVSEGGHTRSHKMVVLK